MAMDDIECAHLVFDCEEPVHKGAAHVVYFVDEVGMQRERTAMVVDAVQEIVFRLPVPLAREDVNVMSATLQRGGKLRDMHGHTTHRD
jgi:hypothetical protein